MEASFFTPWFSGQLVQAICWSLIHSLWIGLLTALVTGGVMMTTQKSAPRLRYRLLSSLLLVFVLTMALIFYGQLAALDSPHPAGDRFVGPLGLKQAPFDQDPVVAHGAGLSNHLIAFVNDQSGWIVALWLVFFVFKSLKLVGGMYYIHRIGHRKVFAVDQHWQDKLDSFRQVLGVTHPVRLVQSALVRVPVTVGLFKPVILVPVGLFFQLSPQQIESILWHELAHIWRGDYLVNILQCLTETVFFFNPGLVWLSSLIRQEREASCDDIALAHSLGKSHYVEALLAFQLTPPSDSALVMGLGSHKLVHRLRRIVTEENKRLSVVEKLALLAGLLILSAFSLLPAAQKEKEATGHPVALPRPALSIARYPLPTPDKAKTQVAQSPLKRIMLPTHTLPVKPAQPLQSAPINRQFTSIVFVKTNQDRANREMMALDDTGFRYHLKVTEGQLVSLEINGVPVAESELNQHQNLLVQIDQALLDKSGAKQQAIAKNRAPSAAEWQREWQKRGQQRKLDQHPLGNQPQLDKKGADNATPPETSRLEISQSAPVLSAFKKKRVVDQKADTVANLQAWKTKKMPQMPDISFDQQRVRGVIAALIQHGVVAGLSAVDGFGLSESELVVNGVRQAAELHQKLKVQYGIKPDYGLYYGSGSGGKGIVLEKSEL